MFLNTEGHIDNEVGVSSVFINSEGQAPQNLCFLTQSAEGQEDVTGPFDSRSIPGSPYAFAQGISSLQFDDTPNYHTVRAQYGISMGSSGHDAPLPTHSNRERVARYMPQMGETPNLGVVSIALMRWPLGLLCPQ